MNIIKSQKIAAALFPLLVTASALAEFSASPGAFRKAYDDYGKELQPALLTTQCRTVNPKQPAKHSILECQIATSNSLLSIDSENGRFSGAWLMVDVTALPHPSDLTRAAGLLLMVAKDASYGNHLGLATAALAGASKNRGKDSCIDDPASSSRLCARTENGKTYDLVLTVSKAGR